MAKTTKTKSNVKSKQSKAKQSKAESKAKQSAQSAKQSKASAKSKAKQSKAQSKPAVKKAPIFKFNDEFLLGALEVLLQKITEIHLDFEKHNTSMKYDTALLYLLAQTRLNTQKQQVFWESVNRIKSREQIEFVIDFVKKFYKGKENSMLKEVKDFIFLLEKSLIKPAEQSAKQSKPAKKRKVA